MTYDIHEHYHRFAVWAACRAAQRGQQGFTFEAAYEVFPSFLKTGIIQAVVKFQDDEVIDFDEQYVDLINEVKSRMQINLTFGRSAKFVAVYLKEMIGRPALKSNSTLRNKCHPPIDRTLLINVAREHGMNHEFCWTCSKPLAWTTLDENEYKNMIRQLRTIQVYRNEFWKIEKLWP